jgi:hypothetical protein
VVFVWASGRPREGSATLPSPTLAAPRPLPLPSSRRRLFMYYAAQLTDDAHWGKNASSIHYDADDGMYLDAMRTLKFVGGNAVMQMLRGPILHIIYIYMYCMI